MNWAASLRRWRSQKSSEGPVAASRIDQGNESSRMSTETVEALRGSGVQKRLRGGPATKGDDAPFAVDGTHYPQSLEAIKPRRDRRRSDGGIKRVGLKRGAKCHFRLWGL
jgi:hypothetical protein